MGSLVDKFKKSASEVGSKAKTMVEINILDSRISQIEAEIAKIYREIGEKAYEGYREDNLVKLICDTIHPFCQKIMEKEQEVSSLKEQINQLKDTSGKDCPSCSAKIPNETKFCPLCGKEQFQQPRSKECENCQAEMEFEAKFCTNCGSAYTGG